MHEYRPCAFYDGQIFLDTEHLLLGTFFSRLISRSNSSGLESLLHSAAGVELRRQLGRRPAWQIDWPG
jgi:hypothetical protein